MRNDEKSGKELEANSFVKFRTFYGIFKLLGTQLHMIDFKAFRSEFFIIDIMKLNKVILSVFAADQT